MKQEETYMDKGPNYAQEITARVKERIRRMSGTLDKDVLIKSLFEVKSTLDELRIYDEKKADELTEDARRIVLDLQQGELVSILENIEEPTKRDSIVMRTKTPQKSEIAEVLKTLAEHYLTRIRISSDTLGATTRSRDYQLCRMLIETSGYFSTEELLKYDKRHQEIIASYLNR